MVNSVMDVKWWLDEMMHCSVVTIFLSSPSFLLTTKLRRPQYCPLFGPLQPSIPNLTLVPIPPLPPQALSPVREPK